MAPMVVIWSLSGACSTVKPVTPAPRRSPCPVPEIDPHQPLVARSRDPRKADIGGDGVRSPDERRPFAVEKSLQLVDRIRVRRRLEGDVEVDEVVAVRAAAAVADGIIGVAVSGDDEEPDIGGLDEARGRRTTPGGVARAARTPAVAAHGPGRLHGRHGPGGEVACCPDKRVFGGGDHRTAGEDVALDGVVHRSEGPRRSRGVGAVARARSGSRKWPRSPRPPRAGGGGSW